MATWRMGIQVIDLGATLTDLPTLPEWQQHRDLFAPNASVNPDAVVATIPVTDPDNPTLAATVMLTDLKVGDYLIEGTSERLVSRPAGSRRAGSSWPTRTPRPAGGSCGRGN